jgi:exopolysaccharide production protein ExoQ
MRRPFLTRRLVEHATLGTAAFALSGAFVRFFASGQDTATSGDKRVEMVLAFFYAAVFLVGFLHFKQTLRAAFRAPALFGLLALACASALWANLPGFVLRRAVGVAGASLVGLVLASRLTLDELLRLLGRVFRIATALSLTVWALSLAGINLAVMGTSSNSVAGDAEAGALRGIFEHKNGLGAVMALAILVEWHLPVNSVRARNVKALWLAAYGALLVFSNSATALVAVVGTLLLMHAVKAFRYQYGLLVPTLSIIGLFSGVFFMLNRDSLMGLLGRSSDLTGRSDLWHWVTVMILKRPWLGYGFSGFWRGASDQSAVVEAHIGWSPVYSHNGYMEILLSLGFVGLALFAWVAGIGSWRALIRAKSARSIEDLWPLAFMVFFLIHNLAECTILLQNNLEWALCVAVVVGSSPSLQTSTEADVPDSGPDIVLSASEEYA